jgi:hypothetical protein
MVLAKGSKFIIHGYIGALAEDYTVGLTTSYRDMYTPPNNDFTQAIDAVGTGLKSVGLGGFSSKQKQFGTQVWDKTEPANVSIGVTFDRVSDAGKDIMSVVKHLCAIPLPGEGVLGNLIPPGPSVLEGVGLDALMDGKQGANTDTYVNFTIGNMTFNRYLMVKAEPTFNKFSDDSGYPISVTIAFDFISMWTATKNTPWGW